MYCPSCGARNNDDAKFCNQCGVRVASMAPVGGGADAHTASPSGPAPTPPTPSVRSVADTPMPGGAPATATSPLGPGAGGGTLTGVALGAGVPTAPAVQRTPTVPVMDTSDAAPPDALSPGAVPGAPLSARLPTMGGTGDSIALPMAGPSKRTMAIAGVGIAIIGIGLGALMGWGAFNKPARVEPAPVPETGVALVERPELIGQGDAGTEDNDNTAPVQPTGRGTRGGSARGTNGSPGNAGGATTGAPATAGARQRPGTTGTQANAGSGGGGTQANNGTGTHTAGGGGGGTPAGSGGGGGGGGGGGTQAAAGTGDTPAGGGGGGGGTQAAAGTGDTPAGGGGGGAAEDPTGVQPHAPGGSGAYTQGEQTDATGRMDPSVFSFVYQHYRSQIASCHSMVARGVEVIGTMRLRVRLATDGHVASTRVLRNTTNNDQLAQCVQSQVRNWRYPQPDGGEVEFDYNFGFGQ